MKPTDTLDPNWWALLQAWALRKETLDSVPILRDQLQQKFVNMLGLPPDSAEYGNVWEECNDLRQHIRNAIWPWAYEKVLTRQEKYNAMADQYRREIGDPNDPVFDAEIDRLLHFWKTGQVLPEHKLAA